MSVYSAQLVKRIGETDQQFLQHNTPQLALERAHLRLQLVQLSELRQEKFYFLQHAIVLVEQARLEFEEMPISVYLSLSVSLAQAYLIYYELTLQTRFALIAEQILKPLAHWKDPSIYFYLAYAAVLQDHKALARHWLNKYQSHATADLKLSVEKIVDYLAETRSDLPPLTATCIQ